MASPAQWTWVSASSRREWRTGKPRVLRFVGLQRLGHNLETDQQIRYHSGFSLWVPQEEVRNIQGSERQPAYRRKVAEGEIRLFDGLDRILTATGRHYCVLNGWISWLYLHFKAFLLLAGWRMDGRKLGKPRVGKYIKEMVAFYRKMNSFAWG